MITKNDTLTVNDFPFIDPPVTQIMEQDTRLKNGVFFDIETTGFSAQKNALYLIGCCWYANGHWKLTQWMAENQSEAERTAVLEAFFQCIRPFSALISYNGTTFDLPFIEKKCTALHLNENIGSWDHIDLYKILRPYKKLLGLENLKLKTIERFLGIFRKDTYSGGALIPVYENFARTGSLALKDLLLLHNYEDIKDMLFILPVLAYDFLFQGNFQVEHTSQPPKICLLPEISLPKALPHQIISLAPYIDLASNVEKDTNYEVQAEFSQKTIFLQFPFPHCQMKFFYEDYKNYYYLPAEDYAIHKSIAKYVDKDYRQKATPATCYTKKAGAYLPQGKDFFTPAFKYSNKDQITWFEYNDMLRSHLSFKSWLQSFLHFLISGSF